MPSCAPIIVIPLAVALLSVARSANGQLSATAYVSGLIQPVGFVQDPSDAAVQYVVEQGGTIRVIVNGALRGTPFLAFGPTELSTGGERGLLGLAFAPDYATNGRFYVNYTNPAGHTVVARFLRSAIDRFVADKSSQRPLVWRDSGQPFIVQPFANHNGGHLAFGPDGYLYIGMGDGGAADDPEHRAQDPATLLGKMLRIDVNVSDTDVHGYSIPPDNPFVDDLPVPALNEIWAFGLRNPWQFSFDDPARGGTGAMLIADVGQITWEEIDYQPAGLGGRNYGWRNREGAHPNPNPALNHGTLPPAYLPLTEPIFEYSHAEGAAITGGIVYRGSTLRANYRGRYFFADFGGRVWSIALVPTSDGEVAATGLQEHTAELGAASHLGLISAFGTDAFGEIYIVSWSSGAILKVTDPAAPALPPPAADFDRDRRPDLLWFHEGVRQLAAWNMGGGDLGERLLGGSFLNAPPLPSGWRVAGTGDVDGDGDTDIFLQSQTGLLGVWVFEGPDLQYGIALNPGSVADPAWQVRAVADFNKDGHPDLAWQYEPTGQVAFWLLNGTQVIGYAIPQVPAPGPSWHIVGSGDSNGDGERDLFWQHRILGTLAAWRMNRTEYAAGVLLSASPSDADWQAAGACDLDHDGWTDILLQHRTLGLLGAWYLIGETVRFGAGLIPSSAGDSGWRVVGPR